MASRGIYKGQRCSADSVKKRVDFQGIQVCVDRPRGFVMEGVDDKGKPWSRRYKVDYGFIPRTLGGDDDGLDVFLGPQRGAPNAFWAVQKKTDGTFDEYKVFLGFPNRNAALSCYEEHIPRKLLEGLTTMRVDMMRSMLGINPKGLIKAASVLSELNRISKDDVLKKIEDSTQTAKQKLSPYTRASVVDKIRTAVKERLDL